MDKAIDAEEAREVAQKVQEHQNDEFAEQFKKSGIMEDIYQKISAAANLGHCSVSFSITQVMQRKGMDHSFGFVAENIFQILKNLGYKVVPFGGDVLTVDWENGSGEIKRKWRRWITS